MGDSHTRSMEGGWNPGEWVSQVPVDCLLNGVGPMSTDMFGGPPHVFPHCGHRFQPPHLSSAHLAPLEDGSVNLAQHSLVVESAQVDDSGNVVTVVVSENNGQDGHNNLNQPLNSLGQDVLESTDDDDDEDEVDDDDDEVEEIHHDQHQQHSHPGPLTMSHMLESDTLVQCSQQVQNSILEQQQQAAMMPMDSFQVQQQQQCLQKQSHVIQHDHSINSLTMSMPEDDFVAQNNNTAVENDPNSGLSVQGKMYLEGRVVLHLKQWADGHIFSSCAEQQHQKRHLHGCVVCRLGSPENYRNPKEAGHRHTVKGVLFTFEDCIIVELYPESPPVNNNNEAVKPPPPPPQSQQKDHSIAMTSYMTPLQSEEQQQEHAKKFMHHIDVNNCLGNQSTNCLGNQQVTVQSQNSSEKHSDHQTETTDWWDGFETTNDELKRGEAEEQLDTNSSQTVDNSSCIGNLKLHSNNEGQDEEEETQRGEENDDDDEDDDDVVLVKSKCPDCSDSFLNSNHCESHSCQTHNSVVQQLEDVDLSGSTTTSVCNINSVNSTEHDVVSVLQISEESQQNIILPEPPSSACMQSEKKFVPTRRVRKRNSCPVCEKPFHMKKLLKQHMEQDHADFTCDQQFTEEKKLKTHSCHVSTTTTNTTTTVDKDNDDLCFEKICAKAHPVVVTELVSNESVDDKMSSDDNDDDDDEEEEDDEDDDDDDEDDRVVVKSEPRILRSAGRKSTRKQRTINTREESSSGQENHDFNDSHDEDDLLMKPSDSNPASKKKIKSEKQKQFKCEICSKAFTVERRLQNHKLSHSTERLSQCEKCGKRFARKDKLMRHMYVHAEEKLFSCEICQKRFSRRDKLSDHLKSHGGMDEIHNCPMCQKQFLRPDILKQHVKLHTMGNKHQCTECLRFVTGKDRLEKHMARHKEAKALGQTLLCPLCTKYFIQKQSLKAHVKKFHPDANINLDTPESEYPQQQSDHDSEIIAPLKSKLHSGKSEKCNSSSKPFVCNQCQRSFARKAALRKHLRKHQTESESPSKSPLDETFNPSPTTSPEEQDNSLSLSLPSTSTTSPVHVLSNTSVTQSPSHVILTPTSQHLSPPPINITNSPSSHESPPHIPPILDLQHNLTSVQCTQIHHPLSHHQQSHHHLLTHGGGISSIHSSGQLPTSLNHMTVPAMHGMTTTQQICGGSSYVLYPYSYQ